MIGDNPSADVKGGRTVGMRTAWLKRGKYYYFSKNNQEKPDITFTNYIQLGSKIKQLDRLEK